MSQLQCDALVSGERCVLVAGHGGACVKPIPRQDMSDVIRYRIALDQIVKLEAENARLRAALEMISKPADHAAVYCHGRQDGLTFLDWVDLCSRLVNLECALGQAEELLGEKLGQ